MTELRSGHLQFLLALLVVGSLGLAPTARASSPGVNETTATQTFSDVPPMHPNYEDIEWLYANGYVAGCATDPMRYCPDQALSRADAAVFVSRGVHGVAQEPPQPIQPVFADVALESWYAPWVHGLWDDGYTAGCGVSPLLYCPAQGHTRAEGTVFFLRMLHDDAGHVPPAPSGIFADIPLDFWAARWIEEAYRAGLFAACGTGPLRFCPGDPLTRGEAASVMRRAKASPVPTGTPTPTPARIITPVKQFIMYQPPQWGATGRSLTDAEIAQKFQSLAYSHNGMARLPGYEAAGFQGDAMVYLIMDTIMGPPGLSSVSAQRTLCTSTQRGKSVTSNNAAMDTGDFCEIHDAIISHTALPDYPDIYPTENWFVHRADGTRLEAVAGSDATYKTNPGDRNWQEYYARRALRELAPTDPGHPPVAGVDGLFIDNVQLNWGLLIKATNNQPPLEYASDAAYAAACVDFVKAVHIKLHSGSYNFPVWGNITPVTASRSWSTVAPYLEGAMQEIFLLSYSGNQPWGTGPADVSTTLQVLDRTESWIRSGKHFVAIAQGNTNADYIKYILSLVLLVTDGNLASYKYRAVTSSNYYEIPEFYAELGAPLGARQQISTNPVVYRRSFECGSVESDLTHFTGTIQVAAGCQP